jgi:UDP:flavonoid glycosyltransferase YjiC (YdhE family)
VTGTPFLWSHASPFAKVPEELAARIAESRNGFHAAWAPQRAVLKHAATGWFISHGGWNSLQEALSLRVPTFVPRIPPRLGDG